MICPGIAECSRPWLMAMVVVCMIVGGAAVVCAGVTDGPPRPNDEAVTVTPMVVSATRWETPASEVAANIAIITREDMRSLPAFNVAEVLQYQPGLYLEFGAGPGAQAGARIQGADFRHVSVYVDGVPLNMLGNPVTNLTHIPVAGIDRIEVTKGAASSAWGSALGGAINIITREPDANQRISGEVRAGYGEFSTVKADATVRGTLDRFGYLVTLTRNESDGFISHTDYEQDSIYAKCHADLGGGSRIGFVFSRMSGEYSDPLPILPEIWDDYEDRRTYQQVNFDTALTDRLDLVLEAHHHDFDLKIDDVLVDGSARFAYSETEEERWGGSLRFAWRPDDTHHIAAHHITFGFDGDWGDYDIFGDPNDYDAGNWAVYASDTLTRGPFSVQAGLRYDHNDDFGAETSPSLGAVYRLPWANALVRAQVAGGFSAPPLHFLFGPDGNPDLKPEKAINYQAGVDVQPAKWLHLTAHLFRTDVDDLIQWQWNDDFTGGRLINIGEVRRQGVEGGMAADFSCGLRVSFSATYVDAEDRTTHDTVPDVPRLTMNSRVSYSHTGVSHTLVGKYIDHNPGPAREEGTKDRRFVFDYRLTATLPGSLGREKTSVYLNAYNLFDVDYQYTSFWPQPGRWIEGGVRVVF